MTDTFVPPPPRPAVDTHAKALAINLDADIYGTFAEIGAGQEVSRWFVKVGAASGTVAHTVSAYDKTVSDSIYGAGTRYVSKERLLRMLDCEFGQLVARLGPVCGDAKKFFVFADTASARNYAGDNEQHAWIGLRYLAEPGGAPNDVILHVALTDKTNERQQEALGILGVNLVHAVHHRRASMEDFLAGVWDALSLSRLVVDVIEFAGPALAVLDVRRCGLHMLRRGMATALVFDAVGRVIDPSGVLRKRPMIVNRGRFAPLEPLHARMLEAAERRLREEGVPLGRDPVRVLEMTLNPADGAGPDDAQVLDRIGPLAGLGVAMVTTFSEFYLLTTHLRRFSSEPMRFAIGVSLLARVLNDQLYSKLPGRLLEGLGKLLASNVKVYIYPMPEAAIRASLGANVGFFQLTPDAAGFVAADGLRPNPPVNHLYQYLRDAGWFEPVTFGPGET